MPPAKGQAGLDKLRFDPVEMSNIVAYTTQFMYFYDGKGEPMDRRDAEFFWALEVRRAVAKDDLNFDRLLSQVDSPANDRFWAEYLDPGIRFRDPLQGPLEFRAFPREPTAAENKADRGLLILGDASHSFLLPGYNLKPVAAIEFSSFVVTLLMRNPELYFTYETITALWSTLILQVYHFEREEVKSAKLSEMHLHSGATQDAAASSAVPKPTIAAMSGVEEQLRHKVSVLEQQLKTLKGRVRN